MAAYYWIDLKLAPLAKPPEGNLPYVKDVQIQVHQNEKGQFFGFVIDNRK